MGKSTKFRERATDIATTLQPHVEKARDKAGPMLADARDKAGPMLADARDKAGPMLADARDKAGPYVAEARERFNRDVIPAVSAAIAAADEATEDARAEGRRRGKAALAALKGEAEAPRKRHRLRNLLFVLGLGGLVAAIAKKLSDREPTTAWQSSYTPPPPPAPASPADDATTGSHRAHDAGAATPDVAAADAEAEPHAATTPDEPAEETDVTKE
ncbi:MAG TPA: hypothetical protein VFJ19_18730 [Nocardioidaceae bacterium]|nr:hypothetical protein [Nocardioidaceae bacterium]